MENFTEKDLVSFGNFLLREKREEMLLHPTNKTEVTDSDLANWKEEVADNSQLED